MIRVALNPIDRKTVHETLLREGFSRTYDPLPTVSDRITEWSRADGTIAFRTDGVSGVGLFLVEGPEEEALAALAARHWPSRSASEAAAEIANAKTPAARAAGALVLLKLGQHLKFDQTLTRASIAEPLAAMMRGDHPIVATAALDAALDLVWPELDAPVDELARARSDLSWLPAVWREARERNEIASRERLDEDRKQKRLDDLPALVEAERWDEALSASVAVFADRKENVPNAAWRARALALVGLGRLWEGAIFTAAWRSKKGGKEAQQVLDDLARRLPDDDSDFLGAAAEVAPLLDDEPQSLADGLEALLERRPARASELAFAIAALRMGSGDQDAALQPAEQAAAAFPDHATSAALLGRALRANGDREGADRALRRAIEVARRGPREPSRLSALSRFERKIAESDEPTLSVEDIYMALMVNYAQPKTFDQLRAVIDEIAAAPDVGPEGRARAFSAIAQVATNAKRHTDAIRYYRQAIAAEAPARRKPSGLLRFNLACELAKQGQNEEAMVALTEAIALDDSYAGAACTDEYFESSWHTSEFSRAVAPWTVAPTKEAVETCLERSLARSYRGEPKAAVTEAHRARSGADGLGDPALAARALHRLGAALAAGSRPASGVAALEHALSLAGTALGSDVKTTSAIRHALATALHAAGRLDEAEAKYNEALDERVGGLGPEHEVVAYSLGDLARLAMERGRHEEAEATTLRAIAILEMCVSRSEGDDRWDALVNLAIMEANRVSTVADTGTPQRTIELAEVATRRLDAIVEAGAKLPGGTIGVIEQALGRALQGRLPPELAVRHAALAARLADHREPNPMVRAERAYWAGLCRGVEELRGAGAADRDIAMAIRRAMRGEDPGEPIATHPAFRNLSVELANRLSAPTDLLMIGLALDAAIEGREPVDKAMRSLEVFAIVNAAGEREEIEDEIGDMSEEDYADILDDEELVKDD